MGDMKNNQGEEVLDVRRRAEEVVAKVEQAPEGREDLQRLVHELRVHQAELEIQNEELRTAQLAVQDARDRYHELYDSAPVGYVTLGPIGDILEANRAAAELLGVDGRGLIGKKLSTFMASRPDADAFSLHLQGAFFSTGPPRGCDVTLKASDGVVRAAHLESAPAWGREERPTSCRTVLLDTTKLHEARAGLERQQSRTKSLLDTAADAIITADAEGRVEAFNRAAEVMFAYEEEEVLGRSVRILIPGFDALRQPGEASGEATAVQKGGATLPVELSVAEWDDGHETMLTAVVRDVSTRKEADRRLKESEERFRQIAENVQDVFYLQERDGRVTYVSPAYESRWGRSTTELLATTHGWLDAVHPEDRGRIEGVRRSALVGGNTLDELYRLLRRDGGVQWIRDRIFPVRTEDRDVVRFVGIAQDVTAERELEEELRQAQKMEAVGTLASGIAHDFRNLLHGIMGCAVLAQRLGDDQERARTFMRKVEDAAKRGATLTDQLLAFTHKRTSRRAPMVLDPVVEESANLLERLLGEAIRLEMATSAPDVVIRADRTEIEHMLMNLAANARDAMPDGGILTISTDEVEPDEEEMHRRGVTERGPYVRVIVRDTGVGMDEATKARIFEPFFTTKGVGRGTGLGLSTVFATARNLGGYVEVESGPGSGTTFTLAFPRCAEVPAAMEETPKRFEPLRGRVLLVEDEPVVRMTLKSDLEDIGLEVWEADHPDRALELFDGRDSFDLVVSDVMMPGMSGPKLAERLRERRPGLLVVYVSAHPEEELLRRGIVPLDAPVLQKPFSKEALAERLAAELEGRR